MYSVCASHLSVVFQVVLAACTCMCGCTCVHDFAAICTSKMTQCWSTRGAYMCVCARKEWWCNALAGMLWNLASSVLRFLHAARVNYPTSSSTQHSLFNSPDHNRAEFNHTRHQEHPVPHNKKGGKNTWAKTNKTFQSQQPSQATN